MRQLKEVLPTGRAMPYNGLPLDNFSKLMYEYREQSNKGFTITDIDFILRNYEKRTFAILEVKTNSNAMTFAQSQTFELLHDSLQCAELITNPKYSYLGFFVLQFEKTSFDDGKATLNGEVITKQDFIKFLSDNF